MLQTDSADSIQKVRVFSTIGCGGGALFLVIRILDGSKYIPFILVVALLFLGTARLLAHLKRNAVLGSHVLLVGALIALGSSQIEDGGRNSLSMWLMSMVPLVAGHLLGSRGILIYTPFSFLAISCPWVVDIMGLHYVEPMPHTWIDHTAIRLVGLISVAAVCIRVAKEYDARVIELAKQRSEVYETHQQAHALNQEKSSFLRQMSRAIRAPLNGIKGMTQFWVRQESTPETQEAVGIMDRCADNLLSMLNDVHDLSRVESRQFQIRNQAFSLEQMVNDVVLLFQAKAQEKQIELVASGSDQCTYGVGDEKRLTQVLSNLVGNAIKFSDKGRVELRWDWIEAPPGTQDTRIRFQVTDQGIGMSASQLAGLFSEFNQVHQEESVRRGGTGLGLTISKKLVEAMDGALEVDSEQGRGSCFAFEIPMAQTEHCNVSIAQAPQDAKALCGAEILLVDDDMVSLSVQRFALENMGCAVQTADCAAQGLALAAKHPFDLAIFDLRMPDIDGISALNKLRTTKGINRSLPAIALTASAEPDDRQACLDAGFSEVIVKPFQYKSLRDMVTRHRAHAQELDAVGS